MKAAIDWFISWGMEGTPLYGWPVICENLDM